MAFDWGGTFTRSQFGRLKSYAEDQKQLIGARIDHLKAERRRIGDLSFAFDAGGVPNHVTGDPPTTYIGKLFGAYEALGGNVEFDLQIRQTRQPVFRLPGDTTKGAQLLSNGEAIPGEGLGDAESTLAVQAIRGWVSRDLARRRDSLERKIRRAIDYVEQLEAEISQLELLQKGADVEGSLAHYFNVIENLTVDRNYMAITNDEGQDPHGKFAKAPIAPFTPGPKGTTPVSYVRTPDGLVKPAL